MYKTITYLSKTKIGKTKMLISEIKPFIRYVHFLPIDKDKSYSVSTPYDNRLFYVLSGRGAVMTDSETYFLSEGDAILIPSGFRYRLLKPESQVTFIGVNFDYTQGHNDKAVPIPPMNEGSFSPDMKMESLVFSDFPELNDILCVRSVHQVSEKLLKMEREYAEKLLGFREVISSLFTEAVVELIREGKNERFGKSREVIREIISYIGENLAAPLSNKHVADAFGLHPNYVSYLVKFYTGMPLHKYLLQARISHAMDLLSKGDVSIGEVAERCGFVDIYHFSKAFKKIVGTSPSKYR